MKYICVQGGYIIEHLVIKFEYLMDVSGEWDFTFLKLLVSIPSDGSIGKGYMFVKR